MTKSQFLDELAHRLRHLPPNERDEAVRFYDEYISDKIEESQDHADAAPAELGTPAELAAQIIAVWAGQDEPRERTDAHNSRAHEPPHNNAEQERTASAYYEVNDEPRAPRKKSGFRTFWIVILAVFASPIALPIGIALIAVAIALFVTLLAVLISIAAGAVAAIVGGILTLVAGFALIGTSFATTLYLIGMSFVAVGLGLILVMCVRLIAKHGVVGLIRMLTNAIRRVKK
ncbi:MAG: DUF1700 domain-containing protein [Oscillospiraceae bacterium]|jgi:uncharacterized membrane protein|nr:DUF1700 domain-containing protein [Oscillospiraceae bacterium]